MYQTSLGISINLVLGCYDNHLINLILVARNKEHSKFMCPAVTDTLGA